MIKIEWFEFFRDRVIFGFTLMPVARKNNDLVRWKITWITSIVEDEKWHGCWRWRAARELNND